MYVRLNEFPKYSTQNLKLQIIPDTASKLSI